MGSDKAGLEWHGSTLLAHTCRTLAASLDGRIVVVRSPGQDLPALPSDVVVVADPRPHHGPLQGLATGLAEARAHADAAFVCATDLPFLAPAVVRRVVAALDELDGLDDLDDRPAPAADAGSAGRWDVALPVVAGESQPLAAAYRTALARGADADVAAGRLSVRRFAEAQRVRLLADGDLLADPAVTAEDPRLRSFVNVNDPRDLARARATGPAARPEVGD